MSRPIDEKIVKMKLDNSDFRSKATETVGIFGKLTSVFSRVKNVSLGKTATDLSNINNQARNIDMGRIATGVEAVASKFNAMGVIAAAVLTNITNRVTNMAINLGKSMSIKPMMDGFSEYELKMGSIQTILANTAKDGTTLKQVTASLDELNQYADKTIYSFGDMTKNIGLFTNAGIGIESATSMIKGFSNEAAVSGVTAAASANAAYQLSQALSAGTIRLMDWRSLTNAGMGRKDMQNGLIEIADKMGELSKAGIDATTIQSDFNGSLEKGWLSADVMSNYLRIIARDMSDTEMAALGLTETQIESFKKQAEMSEEASTKVRTFTQLIGTAQEALGSGWTETFDMLFGDFEVATELWTGVNDVLDGIISRSSDARNKIVKDFVDLGGRTAIIESLKNVFVGLSKVVNSMKDGLAKVFPPVTGKMIANIAKAIQGFTKNLIMSEETTAKVTTIFQALFTILKFGIDAVKLVGRAIGAMIPDSLGTSILDIVHKFAEFILSLDKGIRSTGLFKNKFEGLKSTVESVAKGIGNVAKFIVDVVKGTTEVLGNIGTAVKPIVDAIVNAMKSMTTGFNLNDIVSGGFIGGLFLLVRKFDSLGDNILEVFQNLGDGIKGFGKVFEIFDQLTDSLKAMTTNIKADTLIKIAGAVAILAVSLKLLSSIEGADVFKSLFMLASVMVMLNVALTVLSKSTLGIKNGLTATVVLPALAASILVMAGALKILASIDTEDMSKALLGLAATVTILVTAMIIMGKSGAKIKTSAVSLLGLSVAVVILSSALDKLSQIKASSLAKAVGAMGIVLLELALFLKVVDKTKLNPGSAVAVVVIAGAIHIMVGAISKISEIPVNQIIKGLGTIAIILAEIAIFVKLTSGSKTMAAAVGMAVIAGAIRMLVGPIKELGETPYEVLAKGLGAMALALGAVVLAMRLAQGGMGGAISITIMAAAINMLVPPLQTLGSMSIEQLAKGLVSLGLALGIVAVAAKLIGVGGALALIALAAAITAVGVAALLISVAFTAFTTAFTIFATMLVTNVKNILIGLGELLVGLTELAPQAGDLVLAVVMTMATVLAEAVPTLASSGAIMILGLITALAVFVPDFVNVILEFIVAMANTLATNVAPVIDAGLNLITQLLDGMANSIRDNHEAMVSAVMNTIEAVLEVIIEAMVQIVEILFGFIPGVSETAGLMGQMAKDKLREKFNVGEVGEERGEEFNKGVRSKGTGAKLQGSYLGEQATQGADSKNLTSTGDKKGAEFTKGVGNNTGKARLQGSYLGKNADQGAGSVSLNGTGTNLGQGFVNGVSKRTGAAKTSGEGLGNNAKTGTGSVSLFSSGQHAGDGFAGGISSKNEKARSAGATLGSIAKTALDFALKILSPSREMMESGGYFGEGFAIGIEKSGGEVENKARRLAQGAVDAVKSYASTFADTFNENMDLNPTITPVLDMSNIENADFNNRVNTNSLNSRRVDTRGLDETVGNSSVQYNNTYDIHITANGDLPLPTIKKMAKAIQTEIKNTNDRSRMGRGEAVAF